MKITVSVSFKMGSMQSCGTVYSFIKGAAHKNGDVDDTCKQTLRTRLNAILL